MPIISVCKLLTLTVIISKDRFTELTNESINLSVVLTQFHFQLLIVPHLVHLHLRGLHKKGFKKADYALKEKIVLPGIYTEIM